MLLVKVCEITCTYDIVFQAMHLVGLHFFPMEDAASYTCMTDKVRNGGGEGGQSSEERRLCLLCLLTMLAGASLVYLALSLR